MVCYGLLVFVGGYLMIPDVLICFSSLSPLLSLLSLLSPLSISISPLSLYGLLEEFRGQIWFIDG